MLKKFLHYSVSMTALLWVSLSTAEVTIKDDRGVHTFPDVPTRVITLMGYDRTIAGAGSNSHRHER